MILWFSRISRGMGPKMRGFTMAIPKDLILFSQCRHSRVYESVLQYLRREVKTVHSRDGLRRVVPYSVQRNHLLREPDVQKKDDEGEETSFMVSDHMKEDKP